MSRRSAPAYVQLKNPGELIAEGFAFKREGDEWTLNKRRVSLSPSQYTHLGLTLRVTGTGHTKQMLRVEGTDGAFMMIPRVVVKAPINYLGTVMAKDSDNDDMEISVAENGQVAAGCQRFDAQYMKQVYDLLSKVKAFNKPAAPKRRKRK